MMLIIYGALLLGTCASAMNTDIQKFADRGHYNFFKKPRQVRFVGQDLDLIEQKDVVVDYGPFVSLVHDWSNNLIIATAVLLSSSSDKMVVTVKKKTDVDWTNVYCVEHTITQKSDYFMGFTLETYLKDKIKRFERSLPKDL